MSWRSVVLKVMKVPHEPEPPPGSPPKIFRAAPNYLTLRMVQWTFMQLVLLAVPVVFGVITFSIASQDPPRLIVILMGALQVLAWLIYLTQLVFGWAILRLDYELRWYMLSDRAIRIREGVANVREKTMALANVQDISIRQGPLQGLLKIADVEVKTAGGGSSGAGPQGNGRSRIEPMHVAFFRGVSNAEEIRDLVSEGVRRQRDTGLGDPDDHHASLPSDESGEGRDALLAATELLREARRLRAVVDAAR